MRAVKNRSVYVYYAIILVFAGNAVAQEGFSRILRPIRPGKSTFVKTTGMASEDSGYGDKELGLHRYDVMLAESRAANAEREWFYSAGIKGLYMDGDLILPDTGTKVDELLQDIEFGFGSRHTRANRDMYGWFASVGSASDQAFNSYDEISIMLNAFYKLNGSRTAAWMFMLNYSNRRSFLPNVPIPGAAYVYQPNRRTLIIAGMPFFMIRYPLGAATDLKVRYFVPDQIEIGTETRIYKNLYLLTGARKDEESYFLADRADTDDRLYYEESRVFGGLKWKPDEKTEVELVAGYGFDCFFYQGEDDDDDHQDRVDLDDAASINIALSRRF